MTTTTKIDVNSKVTHVTLKWTGGTHRFHLKLVANNPQHAFYEPLFQGREREILRRLSDSEWGHEDIAGPISYGLLGGGGFPSNSRTAILGHPEVDQLIRQHVLGRPLIESVSVAQAVLIAAIYGLDRSLADLPIEPMALVKAVFRGAVSKTVGG